MTDPLNSRLAFTRTYPANPIARHQSAPGSFANIALTGPASSYQIAQVLPDVSRADWRSLTSSSFLSSSPTFLPRAQWPTNMKLRRSEHKSRTSASRTFSLAASRSLAPGTHHLLSEQSTRGDSKGFRTNAQFTALATLNRGMQNYFLAFCQPGEIRSIAGVDAAWKLSLETPSRYSLSPLQAAKEAQIWNGRRAHIENKAGYPLEKSDRTLELSELYLSSGLDGALILAEARSILAAHPRHEFFGANNVPAIRQYIDPLCCLFMSGRKHLTAGLYRSLRSAIEEASPDKLIQHEKNLLISYLRQCWMRPATGIASIGKPNATPMSTIAANPALPPGFTSSSVYSSSTLSSSPSRTSRESTLQGHLRNARQIIIEDVPAPTLELIELYLCANLDASLLDEESASILAGDPIDGIAPEVQYTEALRALYLAGRDHFTPVFIKSQAISILGASDEKLNLGEKVKALKTLFRCGRHHLDAEMLWQQSALLTEFFSQTGDEAFKATNGAVNVLFRAAKPRLDEQTVWALCTRIWSAAPGENASPAGTLVALFTASGSKLTRPLVMQERDNILHSDQITDSDKYLLLQILYSRGERPSLAGIVAEIDAVCAARLPATAKALLIHELFKRAPNRSTAAEIGLLDKRIRQLPDALFTGRVTDSVTKEGLLSRVSRIARQ